MDISALLGVERGVTALIGGGGKTTLMCTLAEELRRRGIDLQDPPAPGEIIDN